MTIINLKERHYIKLLHYMILLANNIKNMVKVKKRIHFQM